MWLVTEVGGGILLYVTLVCAVHYLSSAAGLAQQGCQTRACSVRSSGLAQVEIGSL